MEFLPLTVTRLSLREIPSNEIASWTLFFAKNLTLSVDKGEYLCVLGENGSGKSTTEKIICGLIRATSGSVKLYGKDYTDADIRAKVGVLIESPGCFPNMTVWNNLKLQADNLSIKNADEEIRKIVDDGLQKARQLLAKNKKLLDNMARLLVERETIFTEEVDMLMEGKSVEEIIEFMDNNEHTLSENPFARKASVEKKEETEE